MKSLLLTIALVTFSLNAFSQRTNSTQRDRIYKAKIKTLTSQQPFKGYVYSISDSTITITSKEVLFQGIQTPPSSTTENTLNYSNIRSISLKRRNRAGNGFLIGAGTGVVLGGTISAALLGNSSGHAGIPPAAAGTIGGVFFGLIGGVIGGAIGSAHDESFRIGGDYQNFKKVKSYFAR